MAIGRHLRFHNDVVPRYIRVNEYTWVGVNDMQALLRKSSKDLKQTRKDF
jgi:hypothetical protein